MHVEQTSYSPSFPYAQCHPVGVTSSTATAGSASHGAGCATTKPTAWMAATNCTAIARVNWTSSSAPMGPSASTTSNSAMASLTARTSRTRASTPAVSGFPQGPLPVALKQVSPEGLRVSRFLSQPRCPTMDPGTGVGERGKRFEPRAWGSEEQLIPQNGQGLQNSTPFVARLPSPVHRDPPFYPRQAPLRSHLARGSSSATTACASTCPGCAMAPRTAPREKMSSPAVRKGSPQGASCSCPMAAEDWARHLGWEPGASRL